MYRIVSGIATLHQHREALCHAPDVYRPPACPHCGLGGLWSHGYYHRKADRAPRSLENPVPIPRFLCRGCRRTCSRLPACIAPRRWYDWVVQQRVLMGRLMGASVHALSRACALARTTVRRWWRALRSRSPLFVFSLRSRFPVSVSGGRNPSRVCRDLERAGDDAQPAACPRHCRCRLVGACHQARGQAKGSGRTFGSC